MVSKNAGEVHEAVLTGESDGWTANSDQWRVEATQRGKGGYQHSVVKTIPSSSMVIFFQCDGHEQNGFLRAA
jgi:hypothetical protein